MLCGRYLSSLGDRDRFRRGCGINGRRGCRRDIASDTCMVVAAVAILACRAPLGGPRLRLRLRLSRTRRRGVSRKIALASLVKGFRPSSRRSSSSSSGARIGDAQLLQQGDELGMEFCEHVLVADDLGQVPGADLTGTTRPAVRVDCAASQEGRNGRDPSALDGGVGGRAAAAACCVPSLSSSFLLMFFALLMLFSGTDEAACNAAKHAPYYGAGAERSTRVLPGQGDKRIAASFAAGHGVREPKDIGDCVSRRGIAKGQRAGR